MTRRLIDYFERRAEEEEERAQASSLPIVRETHRRFADFYREHVQSLSLTSTDERLPPA